MTNGCELRATLPDGKLRVEARKPVNCQAKIKALEPLTSVGPPSDANLIEYSEHGVKVRTHRGMTIGTLVQLQVERSFSLWKVRHCMRDGDDYLLGLEMAKLTHPLRDARAVTFISNLAD